MLRYKVEVTREDHKRRKRMRFKVSDLALVRAHRITRMWERVGIFFWKKIK